MSNITLPLTDAQMLMLEWAAEGRRTDVATLISDSLSGLLAPLEKRFKQAHKDETADLVGLLTPADQIKILSDIKAIILSYPAPE